MNYYSIDYDYPRLKSRVRRCERARPQRKHACARRTSAHEASECRGEARGELKARAGAQAPPPLRAMLNGDERGQGGLAEG